MYRFHGGCQGCAQQEMHVVDFCVKCRYFLPDWNLPDLNNRPPDKVEQVRAELVKKYNIRRT